MDTTNTKPTKMDRATFARIADRIATTLEPLSQELGVVIKRGRGTYDSENGLGTLKIEIGLTTADGVVVTKEARDFRQLAVLYELKPDDLGRTFELRGEKYQLVGLKARATKMPFLVKKLGDGKVYKMTEIGVKAGLKAQERSP